MVGELTSSALAEVTQPGLPGLLKFADEELMVGHILTSQAAWGPELEINLVLSSVGQEELGHARLCYGRIFGETEEAVNAAIYDRAEVDFRSSPFAEYYTGDWAELVVKQYLYDSAEDHRLPVLAGQTLTANELQQVLAEEQFQQEFWAFWLERIATSSDSARGRIQAALDSLVPRAATLFTVDGGTADVAVALDRALAEWHGEAGEFCARLGLDLTCPLRTSQAASEDRARVLSELRWVRDTVPGRW